MRVMDKAILYIGRDDTETRQLQLALQAQGYEVVSTSDSREAAELLRNRSLPAICADGRELQDGEQVEELRAERFPVFTQWFDDWKQRLAA